MLVMRPYLRTNFHCSRNRAIPFFEVNAVWTKLTIANFQGTLLLSFAGTISVCAELISKIMPDTCCVFGFVGDLMINKLIPFPADTLL